MINLVVKISYKSCPFYLDKTIMGKLNDTVILATMNNDDYIQIVLGDGTLGKVKKSNLYPVVSISNGIGLIDRRNYLLYDTYKTKPISYRALKIQTNIMLEHFKTVLFEIKSVLSYNFNGIISFMIKTHIDNGKIKSMFTSNGDFSSIDSIYSYNESGVICFTINFKNNLNISNGAIMATCISCSPGEYNHVNAITLVDECEKYIEGTNSNEVRIII